SIRAWNDTDLTVVQVRTWTFGGHPRYCGDVQLLPCHAARFTACQAVSTGVERWTGNDNGWIPLAQYALHGCFKFRFIFVLPVIPANYGRDDFTIFKQILQRRSRTHGSGLNSYRATCLLFPAETRKKLIEVMHNANFTGWRHSHPKFPLV